MFGRITSYQATGGLERPVSDPRTPSFDVIREFNDRGALWLLEDPANLRDLLAMLEPTVAAALDFEHAQRINRSFIPADLLKRESDLIFRIPTRSSAEGAVEAWVYVLLEHQSRPDREMPLRLLLYMTQLWDAQRREWEDRRVPTAKRRLSPVIPIVLYNGDDSWNASLNLADLMAGGGGLTRFVPSWETLFLDVRHASLESLTSALGWALTVMRQSDAPQDQLRVAITEALRGLESLPDRDAGQWLRAVWYLVLAVFHRRERSTYNELHRFVVDRARQSKFGLREEVDQMSMTMAEFVSDEAARSKVAGTRNALIAMLETRFGPLSESAEQALERADEETLLEWVRVGVSATSLAEIGIA